MTVSGVEKTANIIVHNAAENNLKNISVSIPSNQFTCITGPSGCGKSSLVYDTIYAESQRNFLESMTGNMFGQKLMDKPNVDFIENLKPALNISQKYYNVNPRSTIGTVTDISYYIRTLFAFIAGQTEGKQFDMNYFSPNNPSSCCPRCKGLGEEYLISEQALIPDKRKSLESGGIIYYKGNKTSKEHRLLEAICDHFGIDINKKIEDLSEEEKYQLLFRQDPVSVSIRFKTPKGRYKQKTITECGAFVELQKMLENISIPSTFASISKYLKKGKCSACDGYKLKEEILAYDIVGVNIGEIESNSLFKCLQWIYSVRKNYKKTDYISQIEPILNNIESKLNRLIELKLGYLQLGRSIPTLSGGELQRVRLAAQLDCSLSGLIYILDEPCRGLHYKNIISVIDATNNLVKKGNTVISIEHNKQYISSAENIIEMGPGGGPDGGYILGTKTGGGNYKYHLFLKKPISDCEYFDLKGISYHNLKSVDIRVPIGKITCISGVSGSGKSSLTDVIYECCSKRESDYCREILNVQSFNKTVLVNQKPIGKTPRSTVISYLEIYDTVRDLFAKTKQAIVLGLSSSSFSMNVDGGRCESCQGTGKKKIELAYMPSTYILCPECKGKRFHEDVLSVKYNNYNIDQILNMTIHDLIPVFIEQSNVYNVLRCMDEIGLGYISLGQMSMSLSGGEAQRIKLAKYLGVSAKGNSLYILDEPTSGLNEHDIHLLEKIILNLSKDGDTIIIIEHNIEFISRISDYLIDLGNTAGDEGGRTIISGDVQEVVNNVESSWYDMEFQHV